jgi:tRNA 2-thiouridine synthesizing protein A
MTRIQDPDDSLDARGLLCPLPVLKARKRLQAMASGAVLQVEADDPAGIVDFPHFCTEAGHALLEQRDADGAQIYVIQKNGAKSEGSGG